jgi:hypothetical protein
MCAPIRAARRSASLARFALDPDPDPDPDPGDASDRRSGSVDGIATGGAVSVSSDSSTAIRSARRIRSVRSNSRSGYRSAARFAIARSRIGCTASGRFRSISITG